MKTEKIADHIVAEIVRLYGDGTGPSMAEIGRRFGISRTTVRNYVLASGVSISPHRGGTDPIPLDLGRLVADYRETGSIERAAVRHGVCSETVRRRLHGMGIKPMRGWNGCPDEYMDLYRCLMKKTGVTAADAREMVRAQIEHDRRKVAA